MSEKPAGFCTLCGVDILSFKYLSDCPNCGTTNQPCGIENQVNVSINWHELRVLCMWAERWAAEKKLGNVVYSIAERLAKQFPERTPLTIAGEIGQLKDAGHKVETNFPGIEP